MSKSWHQKDFEHHTKVTNNLPPTTLKVQVFRNILKMRPLTELETKTLFEKLASYTGQSLKHLIDNPQDPHVFRIQKSRVYYVRASLANLATSVSRDALLSLGTCLGKFTKTGSFRLHITALEIIAPHARYKVW